MPRKSAPQPKKRQIIVEEDKPKKRKIIVEDSAKYIKAPKLVVSKKNGQYKIFASIPEDKKMIELKY
jgi:hypothetical protein